MHFTSSRQHNQQFANPDSLREMPERVQEGQESVSEMSKENSSYHLK